ncbi:MAG: hypothetical protein JWO71_3854 [Candidatus Acidoferrum typicum]|nr:hypothetical protein [Candidatus Acidoferrum typicum]
MPPESDAELCPAFADVEVDMLLEAVAPDLSACTDVPAAADELACVPPCANTGELDITSMLPRMTTDVFISGINGPPPKVRLAPQ